MTIRKSARFLLLAAAAIGADPGSISGNLFS